MVNIRFLKECSETLDKGCQAIYEIIRRNGEISDTDLKDAVFRASIFPDFKLKRTCDYRTDETVKILIGNGSVELVKKI